VIRITSQTADENHRITLSVDLIIQINILYFDFWHDCTSLGHMQWDKTNFSTDSAFRNFLLFLDCNLQVLEEDVKVKDWELNGNPEAIIRA